MSNKKKKIIFMGGLSQFSGRISPGGQGTASRILLNSGFSKYFNIFLIDTSAAIDPPELIIIKIIRGVKKFFEFTWICISKRPVAALLFSAGGNSFYEKIVLCLVGRVFGVRSAIAVRSGHFISQVRSTKHTLWYKWLLHVPDVLICQSQSWVDFYSSLGVPINKCDIIPNWIDSTAYISCRTKQCSGKNVTFLFVGILLREKGIYELLDSINMICDKLPEARWFIVGEGPEENYAKNFIKRHELGSKVKIIGWQTKEQLFEYYKIADVFVFPSYAEGFPNVILEAMSAGLPIITTPVGGIPGILLNDIHCIFVQPHDSRELADAMLLLAESRERRQVFSDTVVKHVQNFHEISVSWKKLVTVIDDISNK